MDKKPDTALLPSGKYVQELDGHVVQRQRGVV
jgi:hypothetical protein